MSQVRRRRAEQLHVAECPHKGYGYQNDCTDCLLAFARDIEAAVCSEIADRLDNNRLDASSGLQRHVNLIHELRARAAGRGEG